MTGKSFNDSDDQKRDTVLRRMLETPPKPHTSADERATPVRGQRATVKESQDKPKNSA